MRGSRLRAFFFGPGTARKVGLYGLIVVACCAILAPVITEFSPVTSAPNAAPLEPPNSTHWFGTDSLARDLFARVLYAARVDLELAIVALTVSMAIGIPIGLLAGFLGGWTDVVLGRLIDVAVAFPPLVLIIAIVAMLGPGRTSFYVAVALVSWVPYARIVRGEVFAIRKREYVLAARSLGYSTPRLVFRHVMPNVLPPAIAFAMSDFVLIILLAASLGYFGVGVPAPAPEWGRIIAENQVFVVSAPWLVMFPGLAIMLVGLLVSFLGDGVADWVRRIDE